MLKQRASSGPGLFLVMAIANEQPIVFQSAQQSLYGLLHEPQQSELKTGVLILVGGPQYRVGSHRQFVELARGLALQGIPTFRFDFTGMGDSTGDFPGFEKLDNDIRQAIDAFTKAHPDLQKVILWGLCDGASAACFYASKDERVAGLCLANPWVRTEQGEAEAFLKHYYFSRLMSRDFWHKLLTGKLKVLSSLTDLFGKVKRSRQKEEAANDQSDPSAAASAPQFSLPVRLFGSLNAFPGQVICLISGNDLTAAEFMDAVNKDRKRQKLMRSKRVTMVHLADADHTFSQRQSMKDVIKQTASWIKAL